MKTRFAGGTHVGMKRSHNEDKYFVLPEHSLYIVADGMGGHACGEVASQIAVETVAGFFGETARDAESTWPFKEDRAVSYDENRLITGIKLANRNVYETAQSSPRYRGMGTTIVSLLHVDAAAYVGHVGDSRAYLIRDHTISQLTEDHSLLNDYLKVHRLSDDEIHNFPHKNVIVRALGMKESVAVDVQRLTPEPGDVVLLCSDGLSNMVADDVILQCVEKQRSDLDAATQALINKANEAGGQDNITAILLEFHE